VPIYLHARPCRFRRADVALFDPSCIQLPWQAANEAKTALHAAAAQHRSREVELQAEVNRVSSILQQLRWVARHKKALHRQQLAECVRLTCVGH
jgi:hypothetical protein